MKNFKLIYASSWAATLAAVFVTVITIWSEKSVPLKEALAGFAGHHWVSKSILTMVLYFVVLGIVYSMPKTVSATDVRKSLWVLIYATILGSVAIFLFYLLHFFKVI